MKFLGLVFIFLVQLALGAEGPGTKWIFDLEKGSGSVKFKAIGKPSALKINGKGEKATGKLSVEGSNLSGTAIFVLESLDTGMTLRNEHMKKKYLETEKFPLAKLTFTKVTIPDSLKAENAVVEKLPFEGTLSLHGVDKLVSGTAKVEKKGDELSVVASFGIKISDFGIPTPGFAGITVAEDVDVEVQLSGPYTLAQ
ncbi:MAG: YceI family protein [Bdellovibrionales bacterium]|nr:YceI family protein [Bdellovibrionales bacterium]